MHNRLQSEFLNKYYRFFLRFSTFVPKMVENLAALSLDNKHTYYSHNNFEPHFWHPDSNSRLKPKM